MTSPSSGLDMGESSSSLITKRKIQEMVAQIDPSERLEPEVEDVRLRTWVPLMLMRLSLNPVGS